LIWAGFEFKFYIYIYRDWDTVYSLISTICFMTIASGDTRQLSTLSRLGLFGAVDLEKCSGLLVKSQSKSLSPGEMLLYEIQVNHSYGAYTVEEYFWPLQMRYKFSCVSWIWRLNMMKVA
jgi:hypothetical protein